MYQRITKRSFINITDVDVLNVVDHEPQPFKINVIIAFLVHIGQDAREGSTLKGSNIIG